MWWFAELLCFLPQGLLNEFLITKTDPESAETAESQVFYLKMKGDYHRYLAEVAEGEKKNGKHNIQDLFFIVSPCINVCFARTIIVGLDIHNVLYLNTFCNL